MVWLFVHITLCNGLVIKTQSSTEHSIENCPGSWNFLNLTAQLNFMNELCENVLGDSVLPKSLSREIICVNNLCVLLDDSK